MKTIYTDPRNVSKVAYKFKHNAELSYLIPIPTSIWRMMYLRRIIFKENNSMDFSWVEFENLMLFITYIFITRLIVIMIPPSNDFTHSIIKSLGIIAVNSFHIDKTNFTDF